MTFYEWLSQEPSPYPFLLRRLQGWRIPKNLNKLHALLRFVDKQRGPHPVTRRILKQAHRDYRVLSRMRAHEFIGVDEAAVVTEDEWRKLEKLSPSTRARFLSTEPHFDAVYEEIAELKDIEIPHLEWSEFDSILEASGLKPIGEVTFTITFPASEPLIVIPTPDYSLPFEDVSSAVNQQLILDFAFPDKPERWERVYRRWGFKHRQKCAQCNDEGLGKWSSKVQGLWFCLDSEACRKRAYTCQRCGTTEMVFTTSQGIHVCTACYGYLFVMDTLVNRHED